MCTSVLCNSNDQDLKIVISTEMTEIKV
uniref:Uncharacterized protein n=1 Tax=Rhizophora mucronata TaxID=61149 RepID=A0A2P2PSI8_RHIMU